MTLHVTHTVLIGSRLGLYLRGGQVPVGVSCSLQGSLHLCSAAAAVCLGLHDEGQGSGHAHTSLPVVVLHQPGQLGLYHSHVPLHMQPLSAARCSLVSIGQDMHLVPAALSAWKWHVGCAAEPKSALRGAPGRMGSPRVSTATLPAGNQLHSVIVYGQH